jgi:hypothetical protein
VNQMTRQNTSKWRKPHDQIMRRDDLNKMLDILFAFDRSMVELSMRVYNIPRRDRVAMREQNRRLHHALRDRLPRLLERLKVCSSLPISIPSKSQPLFLARGDLKIALTPEP